MTTTENSNAISIRVYSTGTTEIFDPSGEVIRAHNLTFQTGYPGGLYLGASFYVARDIAAYWQVKGAQRVSLFNGIMPVYEGYITSFDYAVEEAGQGVLVSMVGAWAQILMNRRCTKIWADTRVDEGTWRQSDIAYNAADATILSQADVERNLQIKINCHGDRTWLPYEYHRVFYTAPTGQTIKRVTGDWAWVNYGVSLGGRLGIYNQTDDATEADVSAMAAIAKVDATISNPSQIVWIFLQNNTSGSLAIGGDGVYLFGYIRKLCVYTETGTIDLPAVCQDMLDAYSSDLSSFNGYLTSMGAYSLSLVGAPSTVAGDTIYPSSFGAFNRESVAEILTQAAQAGDTLYNSWAVGLRHSELAPVPDGKPVLFCEAIPALTGYDYAVDLSDQNIIAPFRLKQNFGRIANYITVRYLDNNNIDCYITPDDEATLKDDTAIADYGRREFILDVGNASYTLALQNGVRYLTRYKTPIWEMSGPITVINTIQDVNGFPVPVSQVTAGKRVKLLNWLNDVTGANTGLTFLISTTEYNDESQSVSITCGPPPDLIFPTYVVPIEYEGDDPRVRETPDEGSSGGGRGGGKPSRGHKWDWEKNPAAHRGRWGERD